MNVVPCPWTAYHAKRNFVVRGDLDFDIVTPTDLVTTLVGCYSMPAYKQNGEYASRVPWIDDVFHPEYTGAFDIATAFKRSADNGPLLEIRGARLVFSLRATEFTEGYFLAPDTPLANIKITAPLQADEAPNNRQDVTLVIARCSTHPVVKTIGQLLELSKPENRPTRFNARFAQAQSSFVKAFGADVWQIVADRLRAAYGEQIRQLLEPRSDGWEERRRLQDLQKIEAASVAYVNEVAREITSEPGGRKAADPARDRRASPASA